MLGDTGASGEATPLLTVRRISQSVLVLVLFLKLSSNMFDTQMSAFDVMVKTHANCSDAINCTDDGSQLHMVSSWSATLAVATTLAAVTITFPALAGALSDRRLGCIRMLWVDICLQLCGSVAFGALGWLSVIRQLPPNQLTSGVPIRTYMSLGDTMMLYSVMQFAAEPRTSLLVINVYFVASGSAELLGHLPSVLRYLTGRSCEFLGVIFSVASIACMLKLCHDGGPPELRAASPSEFSLGGSARLRRFFVIAACTIPHFASVALSRFTVYPRQLSWWSRTDVDKDIVAAYLGSVGYLATRTLVCALTAIGSWRGGCYCVPAGMGSASRSIRDSLRRRIRAGYCLMITVKLFLLIVSLVDYNTSAIESWCGNLSLSTLRALYVIFPLLDGLGDALAIVASYELICYIANRRAKATYIGVFYTVYAMADILKASMQCLLSMGNVLVSDTGANKPPQFHWAYATATGLLLLSVAYWEAVSWPRVRNIHVDELGEELVDEFPEAERGT